MSPFFRLASTSVLAALALWIAVPGQAESIGADAGPTDVAEGVTREASRGEDASIAVLGAWALFGSGETSLRTAGSEALDRLLDRLPQRHGSVLAIRVIGHTDSVGSTDLNRRLSERRAEAVAGVIRERWSDVPVRVEGAGESAPISSNATAEGRARNRRVEIHAVTLDESR